MHLIALLAALAAVPSATTEIDAIVKPLKHLLELKEQSFPYYAEYEMALPPQPRIAGATENRRFIAENPDMLYSETTRDIWSSHILIKRDKFYWQYADQTDGSDFFTGSVRLGQMSPELWLREHLFVSNAYKDLDGDLVLVVRDVLKESRVVLRTPQGQLQVLTLRSPSGQELIVRSGPSLFELARRPAADKPTREQILLRYSYRTGKPRWTPNPCDTLLQRIAKAPKDRLHALTGEIKMPDVFEKFFAGMRELRNITVADAKRLAERYGYLLPENTAVIQKAQTHFRALHLEIKWGEKTYIISQAPPESGSRARDAESLKRLAKATRNFNEYTVLKVERPAMNGRWVYYFRNDAILCIAQPADFDDPKLDELIATFSPVQKR